MAKATKAKVIKDQPAKNVKTSVGSPKGNKMKKTVMKKGGQKMC